MKHDDSKMPVKRAFLLYLFYIGLCFGTFFNVRHVRCFFSLRFSVADKLLCFPMDSCVYRLLYCLFQRGDNLLVGRNVLFF